MLTANANWGCSDVCGGPCCFYSGWYQEQQRVHESWIGPFTFPPWERTDGSAFFLIPGFDFSSLFLSLPYFKLNVGPFLYFLLFWHQINVSDSSFQNKSSCILHVVHKFTETSWNLRGENVLMFARHVRNDKLLCLVWLVHHDLTHKINSVFEFISKICSFLNNYR